MTGPSYSHIFYPISGARAFEEVAEQLTFAIRSGTFKIGEKLPSIEELSVLMQVSKPTVGQALKLLADAKIIDVLRGVHGGAVVRSNFPLDEPLSNAGAGGAFTFIELVEARRPLEIEIALLASRHGTDEEFAELDQSVKDLRDHRDSRQPIRTYHDHRFHYLMGKMSRNRLLAIYQHQILERLYYEMTRSEFLQKDEDVDSVISWHEATLKAVANGDTDEIRAVVISHLRPLEEFARSIGKTPEHK